MLVIMGDLKVGHQGHRPTVGKYIVQNLEERLEYKLVLLNQAFKTLEYGNIRKAYPRVKVANFLSLLYGMYGFQY